MKSTMKIKVFRKSILFWKYLLNGSSHLYEILFGGQLLSCELKFHEDPWPNAHARVVNARTCEGPFTTRARAYMHGSLWNLMIVNDHQIEFHKNPSFHCGDICKKYWLSEYFNFQYIFHIFTVSHLKSLSRWMITE